MQVFNEAWFALWGDMTEVWTAQEAEGSCPRQILEVPGEEVSWMRYQVVKPWESEEDLAEAAFEFREQALLFTTAVAAEGASPGFSLGSSRDEKGWFPIHAHYQVSRRTGGSQRHEVEVLKVMQALHAVVADPTLLSNLMEAAGARCVEAAGQLLARRLRSREDPGSEIAGPIRPQGGEIPEREAGAGS